MNYPQLDVAVWLANLAFVFAVLSGVRWGAFILAQATAGYWGGMEFVFYLKRKYKESEYTAKTTPFKTIVIFFISITTILTIYG